jgi:hypothetical protein
MEDETRKRKIFEERLLRNISSRMLKDLKGGNGNGR